MSFKKAFFLVSFIAVNLLGMEAPHEPIRLLYIQEEPTTAHNITQQILTPGMIENLKKQNERDRQLNACQKIIFMHKFYDSHLKELII